MVKVKKNCLNNSTSFNKNDGGSKQQAARQCVRNPHLYLAESCVVPKLSVSKGSKKFIGRQSAEKNYLNSPLKDVSKNQQQIRATRNIILDNFSDSKILDISIGSVGENEINPLAAIPSMANIEMAWENKTDLVIEQKGSVPGFPAVK